jgi:hypothetical protein
MQFSLCIPDPSMSRTIYFERLLAALRASPRFVEDPARADVIFPAEDTPFEHHWPRYGATASVYLRGQPDHELQQSYLSRLAEFARSRPPAQRLCIINNHPFYRLGQSFKDYSNVIIADANLHAFERALNPRTIAWPAPPMMTPAAAAAAAVSAPPKQRDILASFRGALSSPVRNEVLKLHNGREIICESADRAGFIGRIDASTGAADARYVELLERSVFAIVPRGDALFSYRLLEVMSFDCIPVVLSDGWILPFDRTIPWTSVAVFMPEAMAHIVPQVLAQFSTERIAQMQRDIERLYRARLASFGEMIESLMVEIEQIERNRATAYPIPPRSPAPAS